MNARSASSPRALVTPDRIADWTWMNLSHGADAQDHPFHLLTMATVTPDGRPAARLMTNRGVDRGSGQLWCYTHTDTPKVADLRSRSAVCFIGYDPSAGVQLRLSGVALLHEHDALADQHWQHVADVSRWLFGLSPEDTRDAVGIDPRLPQDHDLLAKGLTARSRAHFGVLEITIETIDWHQTNGAEHCRAVMHAAHNWRAAAV